MTSNSKNFVVNLPNNIAPSLTVHCNYGNYLQAGAILCYKLFIKAAVTRKCIIYAKFNDKAYITINNVLSSQF